MEAYLCRGRYIVNLKYDWLMMMSLGGAVVSFYHVTSWRNPVTELEISELWVIVSLLKYLVELLKEDLIKL